MKRKIVLTYKKNGTFNQAVLTIDKKSLNILNVKQDEMVVYLSYLNNEITLKKTDNKRVEKIIIDKDGNLKELSKNIKHNPLPHFHGKSLPDLGLWGNPGAEPFPSFCRDYHLRNSWQKLFPCHDLSSQYCFCGSFSYHVVAICL